MQATSTVDECSTSLLLAVPKLEPSESGGRDRENARPVHGASQSQLTSVPSAPNRSPHLQSPPQWPREIPHKPQTSRESPTRSFDWRWIESRCKSFLLFFLFPASQIIGGRMKADLILVRRRAWCTASQPYRGEQTSKKGPALGNLPRPGYCNIAEYY